MNITPQSPIGIFDSGIGGLTVVKAVQKVLPNENIIYFGDTARVPYGIKSVSTIREYAMEITNFLLSKGVKMIVIACNTVSASAEEMIVDRCKQENIPVLGVVASGAQAVHELNLTNKRVGVIGTLATVGSGAYERALHDLNEFYMVYSKACPLLVPLAEEGWTDTEVTRLTLKIYLETFKDKHLDALILGCTHYPLFKKTIQTVLNDTAIMIVDSADSIAKETLQVLRDTSMLNTTSNNEFECYVSDKPQRFQQLAELFLGKNIYKVEVVNLEQIALKK